MRISKLAMPCAAAVELAGERQRRPPAIAHPCIKPDGRFSRIQLAIHCKTWRDCDHPGRLDSENGLFPIPTTTHLFDRGPISFANDGDLLIFPVAYRESLHRIGVAADRAIKIGGFNQGRNQYLDCHRKNVQPVRQIA